MSGISFPMTLAAGQRKGFAVTFTAQAAGSVSGNIVVTTDNSDWATNCPEYKVTAVQVSPSNGPSAWQDSYREMAAYVGDDDPTTRRLMEEILAKEDIELEVVDLRSVLPLDRDAIQRAILCLRNFRTILSAYPLEGLREAAEAQRLGYAEADPTDDVRFRVIADHARSGVMIIGDGVTTVAVSP